MTVCILTSSYPRFPGDYAGIFVAELAQELVKQGIDVVVLAPRSPGLKIFETSEGVRIYRFPYFWPRRWELVAYGSGIPSNLKRNPLLYLLLPFFFFGQIKALRRLIRKEKIDIVNAHWMVVQGLAAAWLRKKSNFRFVLTIHSAGLQALVRWPLGRVVADWIVRGADHIFCVSSAHHRLLERFLGRQVAVEILPMGIDLARFDLFRWPQKAARQRFGIGNGKVILFLGRLEEIKGARFLIEAVRAQPDFSNGVLSLYIAGDGQERTMLEEMVTQSKLEKQIHFLGTVTRDEVPPLIAAADVVCVPSIVQKDGVVEGVPLVVLEALAMGKVVIASRVGGIPDLIRADANGFLVEPGNSQAIADKISIIVDRGNELDSVREAARCTADRYGWERVAGRYSEVFQGLQGSP